MSDVTAKSGNPKPNHALIPIEDYERAINLFVEHPMPLRVSQPIFVALTRNAEFIDWSPKPAEPAPTEGEQKQ